MDTAESTRYRDFEWATKLNRLTLNAIGIWPSAYKNASDKFLSNLRTICAFVILIFIGIIPTIHSLVRISSDMMSAIDNLQYTLPLLITVIKLIIIWWKKKDLILVINMIAADWKKVKTDKELRVMMKRAQYARILAIVGYTFMFLSFSIFVVVPLFGKTIRYRTNITDPGRILPMQSHYLYDKNRSPYFELTFASHTILTFVSGTIYSGVDNLFGLLTFHLCGQLENLKEKLITMKEFKNFKSGLSFIVKDHMRLIKCYDIIENTFTMLLLGVLFYFSTTFCLYGFLTMSILREGKKMSLMRLIFLICTGVNISAHMCLFCAVGELLVTHCEGIYYAAYEYQWYKLEPNNAKTLIIIMIRAAKPFYITAGNMFPMTMSMFCNLIKTSAGYISILVTMQS